MEGRSMIALSINQLIWEELTKDAVFDALYDKHRTQFGQNFIPFFPVSDNYVGDIAWGIEPYFIYDSISLPPNRDVFGERREQILYTMVGKIPELFVIEKKVIHMFSFWESDQYNVSSDEYRITSITAWQPLRTNSRDSLRQTHAIEIMVDVNYIPC